MIYLDLNNFPFISFNKTVSYTWDNKMKVMNGVGDVNFIESYKGMLKRRLDNGDITEIYSL